MESTVKRNLLIGFGVSLLLLVITSVASFVSIQNLMNSSDLVDHTNDVIQQLEKVMSSLKDAETGQRGYLITGNEKFLAPYTEGVDSVLLSIQRVQTLVVDNPTQQKNALELEKVVTRRLDSLRELIDRKKLGKPPTEEAMNQGRRYMLSARDKIDEMVGNEKRLLKIRTEKMNQFAGYTPVLIIIAALLSILITVVFYVRVNNDLERRVQLQEELEKKDAGITRRISTIRSVSEKISDGDYSVRVTDEEKDGLGNVAVALNKMAASLEYSFGLLSDKEWLQKGIASLNEKMLGEYELENLAYNITAFTAGYTESQVGAFYLREGNDVLRLVKGYALNTQQTHTMLNPGEGLVGQCAISGQEIFVEEIPEGQISISHATGEVKPTNIAVVPLFFERKVMGVLEIASVHKFTANDRAFLNAVSHNVGTVINSVENRRRLQELLEETQSQAEELQAQHNELENMNSELEAQAEKLQASEEELKVQQEELLEANQELEERTRLLEEKNQLIIERNLEIQKKAEELALSTKYKSEFLANMSHELRTPLNSILLLSKLMAENSEQNLTSDQVEYARVILSSGNGLLSLIDEILDLSKVEAGKMELQYGSMAIQEMVQDMQALFLPVAREKGIEFRVAIDAGAPAMMETDKMRLEQIIKNLVSNALKFTAEGFVKLEVFSPEDISGVVALQVQDTGIGISKEKQQLVFEAFQQADGSTRRKYGGTGLGLSISRELARLLGGEIKLESEPGKGSRFTVYVPVSQELAAEKIKEKTDPVLPVVLHEPAAVKAEPARISRYISPVIPESIPDDRQLVQEGDKVLLIVEDDTNFARSLLEFARQRGYRGVVSVRGDQALELATQYQPLGVLLDIQLPIKDGWEVMHELKNNPRTRHIPVHIMSSHEVKNKSLSEGAIDFVNKPVAFEKMQEIFKKIEYVLSHNPRKVLIVEENTRHAKALAYFLETYSVNAEIRNSVELGVEALQNKEVNCVILDMGVPDQQAYDTLEEVKKTPGLESTPIIIFTGKSLSRAEEMRIRQYADSIIIKTAHSYQRIMDEVSLFLHLVEESGAETDAPRKHKNLGLLQEVLKNKKVLIADDDVRNIYSLTKSLETYQMEVVSATDGKDALRQLTANPDVDIVLMDMMMPEMDGYETTRRIKANQAFKNLPVIAVTAKAMTGDREKCISAGASDYITKPVDIDQLLSLLRVWLYDSNK